MRVSPAAPVRRQQVIGPFIVDFYCAPLRLAIELDGPIHEAEAQTVRDLERAAQIAALGVHIIRIRNDELTAEHLRDLLGALTPPLSEGEWVGG